MSISGGTCACFGSSPRSSQVSSLCPRQVWMRAVFHSRHTFPFCNRGTNGGNTCPAALCVNGGRCTPRSLSTPRRQSWTSFASTPPSTPSATPSDRTRAREVRPRPTAPMCVGSATATAARGRASSASCATAREAHQQISSGVTGTSCPVYGSAAAAQRKFTAQGGAASRPEHGECGVSGAIQGRRRRGGGGGRRRGRRF